MTMRNLHALEGPWLMANFRPQGAYLRLKRAHPRPGSFESKWEGGGTPGFVYGRGSTRPDPSMANFTPVARALAAPLFTRAKIKYHRLIVTSFQSLAAPDSSVNLSVVRRKYLLGPNMTFSGLRWTQIWLTRKGNRKHPKRTCGTPFIVFYFGCFNVCAAVPILPSM